MLSTGKGHDLNGEKYGYLAYHDYDGYEYSDGNRYYMLVEFKSNGICLWKYHYTFYPATYEYADGEYIIQVQGDGIDMFINAVYKAVKSENSLYVSGPGMSGETEFVRIKG